MWFVREQAKSSQVVPDLRNGWTMVAAAVHRIGHDTSGLTSDREFAIGNGWGNEG